MNRHTRRMLKAKGIEMSVRTKEDIQRDFTQKCAQAGEIQYKIGTLHQALAEVNEALSKLNEEFVALKEEPADVQAETQAS